MELLVTASAEHATSNGEIVTQNTSATFGFEPDRDRYPQDADAPHRHGARGRHANGAVDLPGAGSRGELRRHAFAPVLVR